MNRIKILLIFIISILISSCSEENIIIPVGITPSSDFFPISIGNYWQYEESFSSTDTNYINIYKSLITGIEEIGGYSWFKRESVINNYLFKNFLMTKNDSVYMLQYTWQNPVRSLEYLFPHTNQQSFTSLLGGDVGLNKTVTKLDTILDTKIGKFNNCLLFESSTLEWTHKEILVFGIGIVESKFISYNLSGEQQFKRIIKIVDAKIN